MTIRRTFGMGRRLLVAALRAPRESVLVYGGPCVGVPVLAFVLAAADPRSPTSAIAGLFLPVALGILGFALPAILGFLLLARQRREGVLDRLLATPIRALEIAGGHAVFLGVAALVWAVPMTALVTWVAHRVSLVGVLQVGAALAFLPHFAFGLGFLVSAAIPDSARAARAVPLILLAGLVLSGTFWPVSTLPVWARPLSWLGPVYGALETCRAFLRGAVGPVWHYPLVLAGMSAFVWLASAVALGRGRR
jgi:ABC-2 type transport system permease protein